MSTADLTGREKLSTAPMVVLPSLTLIAGVGGMLVSFLFLSSNNSVDVIAGGVGFLVGGALVTGGVISLAVQSGRETTRQVATHAAGCLIGCLPPLVNGLSWPILFATSPHNFSGEVLCFVLKAFVSLGCLVWASLQTQQLAQHVSQLLAPKRVRWLPAVVYVVQLLTLVAPWVTYTPAAQWLTRSRGEHMAWSDVHERIGLHLPQNASDIRYYQHWHPDRVVVVDFALDEATFLQWAASQGWPVQRTTSGIQIWPRTAFGDTTTQVVVKDGFEFNNYSRGAANTFSITFDRGTKRAYYDFHSEPSGEN